MDILIKYRCLLLAAWHPHHCGYVILHDWAIHKVNHYLGPTNYLIFILTEGPTNYLIFILTQGPTNYLIFIITQGPHQLSDIYPYSGGHQLSDIHYYSGAYQLSDIHPYSGPTTCLKLILGENHMIDRCVRNISTSCDPSHITWDHRSRVMQLGSQQVESILTHLSITWLSFLYQGFMIFIMYINKMLMKGIP